MADEDSLDLFAARTAESTSPTRPPLAERMRPRSLEEVVGQDELVGANAPLRGLAASQKLPSLILWGPPGSGKTSLARLLAAGPASRFHPLSAVLAGVKDVRDAVQRANLDRASGRRFVLFIDEIHRFNRAQQDALLPHVEAGILTLIGATTENPSFEVVSPLLSRCRVYRLNPLEETALVDLLGRAASDPERGLGASGIELPGKIAATIAHVAEGDARRALNLLEAAFALEAQRGRRGSLREQAVAEVAGQRVLLHDRDREEHYNVASAFIKSLRASDPDAALYYLARMLEAGDDPLFAARRLVVFASEDVGNAEPAALPLATAAMQAVERIGMPEARIPLAQAVTFLACAPKSNASYVAFGRAQRAVAEFGSAPVPMHLRNAPTRLMKESGYGRDYRYPHDAPDGFVAARNLPAAVDDRPLYEPTDEGAERGIAQRLRGWRARREKKS